MASRQPIPEQVSVTLLVDNLHTCCICHWPHNVQIHHIDGDSSNNDPKNLSVLCLNCHSRVTGDEGLGRRYSAAEVSEHKRRWEEQCKAWQVASLERLSTEAHLMQESVRRFNHDSLSPIFINLNLSRAKAAKVGLQIDDRFGPHLFGLLKEKLSQEGMLDTLRPRDFHDLDSENLICESVSATKVIFPREVLNSTVSELRELVVWVSEPDREVMKSRSDDAYDFAGTFLYLVTPLYEDDGVHTFYSGCSALQVISNLITGQPFMTRNGEEPFGRSTFKHPIDKLKEMGGIVIDRRSIEALYVCRYMSDEQCFNDGESAYRCHDLLGYPLYIGNCLKSMVKHKDFWKGGEKQFIVPSSESSSA